MKDLKIYIKQDGMYNTLEIVLSNIPVEDVKDWYSFGSHKEFSNLMEILLYIDDIFLSITDSTDCVRIIDRKISDEITITKKQIREMYPQHFI